MNVKFEAAELYSCRSLNFILFCQKSFIAQKQRYHNITIVVLYLYNIGYYYLIYYCKTNLFPFYLLKKGVLLFVPLLSSPISELIRVLFGRLHFLCFK